MPKSFFNCLHCSWWLQYANAVKLLVKEKLCLLICNANHPQTLTNVVRRFSLIFPSVGIFYFNSIGNFHFNSIGIFNWKFPMTFSTLIVFTTSFVYPLHWDPGKKLSNISISLSQFSALVCISICYICIYYIYICYIWIDYICIFYIYSFSAVVFISVCYFCTFYICICYILFFIFEFVTVPPLLIISAFVFVTSAFVISAYVTVLPLLFVSLYVFVKFGFVSFLLLFFVSAIITCIFVTFKFVTVLPLLFVSAWAFTNESSLPVEVNCSLKIDESKENYYLFLLYWFIIIDYELYWLIVINQLIN